MFPAVSPKLLDFHLYQRRLFSTVIRRFMPWLKGSRLFPFAVLMAVDSAITEVRGQSEIIVTGDSWAYWDAGSEPDPQWASPNYLGDSNWDAGPSPLGFGESYIVTPLQSLIMAAYFRHRFAIQTIPSQPAILRVRRDDGVVVYLNGVEVFRNNMPPGRPSYDTPALDTVEASSYFETTVAPALFVSGQNVIAAEVHQFLQASSDLVFDLQLQRRDGPVAKTVLITSPTNNTTVGQGNDVAITANASPTGEVVRVEFYRDDDFLGSDQQAPFQAFWLNASPGDYSLWAVAAFSDSTTRTSAPVHVTVAGSERILRGPYLQLGTPTSVFVKWRTDFASDSLVRFGTTPANLDRSAQVSTVTIDHEVPLTGLSPDTKYYYSIGSSSALHGAGDDFFLVTSPPQPKPTRIWVIGDSGTGSSQARDVWLSYSNYTRGRYTDVWLMLGDNAYGGGSDDEYQRGMFDMYPDILRQTVVWPTIGNHDASPAYFDIFVLPRNGEAGGVASGVENYYSFDYGDIHFICLGGYYSGSRGSNGTMCTWLKADLEANTNKWLIAYWHQPPYTWGSHNSDFEGDLIEMRENAVPILETYGVDLVLCGHSHNYERSYLMRGHYGDSSTLQPSMLLDSGSGRVDDTGPYVKKTDGTNAHHGTIYVVAGSSGWATGSRHHPAMYINWLRMGSLVLDIDGDTLNGTFLRENGDIDDYFTLVKASTVVRIANVKHNGNTTTLTWTSTRGRHYLLEFTTNLTAWTVVGNPIEATSDSTTMTHTINSAPRGFYRVLETNWTD